MNIVTNRVGTTYEYMDGTYAYICKQCILKKKEKETQGVSIAIHNLPFDPKIDPKIYTLKQKYFCAFLPPTDLNDMLNHCFNRSYVPVYDLSQDKVFFKIEPLSFQKVWSVVFGQGVIPKDCSAPPDLIDFPSIPAAARLTGLELELPPSSNPSREVVLETLSGVPPAKVLPTKIHEPSLEEFIKSYINPAFFESGAFADRRPKDYKMKAGPTSAMILNNYRKKMSLMIREAFENYDTALNDYQKTVIELEKIKPSKLHINALPVSEPKKIISPGTIPPPPPPKVKPVIAPGAQRFAQKKVGATRKISLTPLIQEPLINDLGELTPETKQTLKIQKFKTLLNAEYDSLIHLLIDKDSLEKLKKEKVTREQFEILIVNTEKNIKTLCTYKEEVLIWTPVRKNKNVEPRELLTFKSNLRKGRTNVIDFNNTVTAFVTAKKALNISLESDFNKFKEAFGHAKKTLRKHLDIKDPKAKVKIDHVIAIRQPLYNNLRQILKENKDMEHLKPEHTELLKNIDTIKDECLMDLAKKICA